MRCSYKNCFCEDSEEIVKNGKWSYHPQCLETKNDINEIAKLFQEKVNSNVVYSVLYNTINNIVFNKGVQSKYLKFGLKYYIDHKIPLNYPGGLHYVVQNKDVKKAWDSMKSKEIKQKIKEEISVQDTVQNFGYVPKKNKTITDLLGE